MFLFIFFSFPFPFRGYQQQDAHEFMRYLLDKLHTELTQALKSRTSEEAENTIVSDIFGGVLQSDVSCKSLDTALELAPYNVLGMLSCSEFSEVSN